jgi:microcystin-dependent protein
MEAFIGQIIMVAFNYPLPQGWALCNGQLLSIEQYTTLYSLIGSQYGGDGLHTFALPDLRSRTAIGAGLATFTPNLGPLVIGQEIGAVKVTLTDPIPLTTLAQPERITLGSSQPINVMQPSLVVNYLICLAGWYPSQSDE